MVGIYKITSPTGRIYVGQSVELEERFIAYSNFRCKAQKLLYNSIKKNGWESHIWEIVIKGDFDKQTLNFLEEKYVKEFNSFRGWSRKGMNLTTGGDSPILDISVKTRISKGVSKYHKTIGHSKETKNKIAQSLLGKKQSTEIIEKRKESNKKCWQEKNLRTPFSKYARNKKKEFNAGIRGQKELRNSQIASELKSGMQQQLLAIKYNISPSLITQIKNKHNITTEIKRKGSANGFNKLSEQQVIEIKTLLKEKVLHKVIAEKYSVKTRTIKAIASGQNWAHITI